MKKVVFVAIFAMGLTVLSSYNTIAPEVKKQALTETFHFNDKFDIGGLFWNPCTNEYINVSGIIHYVQNGVYNEKQSTIRVNFHANTQGVSGTGEISGKKYQLNETYITHTVESFEDCSVKYSVILNGTWTTAGSKNNWYYRQRLTYNFNYCTGEFDVERDVFENGCK